MADIFQIENGVLKKCTDEKATSVTIPDGVKEITWMAFRRCTSLESVAIPGSVWMVDWEAFKDCTSLEFLEFTGTMAQWDSVPKKLWAKDSKITSVKCTDGVIPL